MVGAPRVTQGLPFHGLFSHILAAGLQAQPHDCRLVPVHNKR